MISWQRQWAIKFPRLLFQSILTEASNSSFAIYTRLYFCLASKFSTRCTSKTSLPWALRSPDSTSLQPTVVATICAILVPALVRSLRAISFTLLVNISAVMACTGTMVCGDPRVEVDSLGLEGLTSRDVGMHSQIFWTNAILKAQALVIISGRTLGMERGTL